MSGQSGDDKVDGGRGADAVDTTSLLSSGGDRVPGHAGNDRLSGGATGNDVINVAAGRDTVDGGSEDDLPVGINSLGFQLLKEPAG